MQKNVLNKQDQWLIDNWRQAAQLEAAMISAREHYKALFTEVHKLVRLHHTHLDQLDVRLSASDVKNWGGQILISDPRWPHLPNEERWRTGFYIWGVSLDELASEREIEPAASIWLSVKQNSGDKRLAVLRRQLSAKAQTVFKNRNLTWRDNDPDDDRICLCFPLPEGRTKLLRMAMSDDRAFVECMANHFRLLASFVPTINKVLNK